jgi:hypothetical protein
MVSCRGSRHTAVGRSYRQLVPLVRADVARRLTVGEVVDHLGNEVGAVWAVEGVAASFVERQDCDCPAKAGKVSLRR